MSGSTLGENLDHPSAMSAAAEPVMLPASFAQELLWLTDRASPGSVAYNVPRTRRLRGPLDVRALRGAFDALVARHEILRTTYATHEEQVVQVIHPPRPVPFDVVDLGALAPESREAEAIRLVAERSARPFDLGTDLLLRVTLVRMADDDHVLLFESHHIAFDGWSRDIVFRELAEFYASLAAGREPALPPLPIQYADFAIWQREQLQGEALESLLGYWRRELGDAEHVLRLPTDFPRPASSRYEGLSRDIRLPASLRDEIRRLGQRYEATPYMVMLAAYATVLHRYTGQDDVLVGSPIAGRARPETHDLIGYFANTIVQRARFAGDPTFAELLAGLRESALSAYDHQDVPFEKLVLHLEAQVATGRSPLFQVVLTQIDGSEAPAPRMGDVELGSFALDMATTKFDLTLFMADRPDGLGLMLRARSDLHRPDTVEAMLGHIRGVLEAAVADPQMRVSELPLLGAAERAQLAAWNDTAAEVGPPATLVGLFERQAARIAGRDAVVGGGVALTYRELDARANQLAHRLASAGVGPGAPVGLLLDRSADAVVGLLGILKAGGAYMPLSVDAPAARLAQQMGESGAKVAVTSAALAERLPSTITVVALDRDADALRALPEASPATAVGPDSLAYVLFTSGSTGVPKGVAVTHANAVHYARAVARVIAGVPQGAADDGLEALGGWTFGMASTLAADLGNTALLPSLLGGGTLHLLEREVTTEPARFVAYVAEHPLDVLKITPNHLRALVGGLAGAELAGALPRRWVVLGGEALAWDFAQRLLAVGRCRVLNHYGPTETTVGVSTFEVTAERARDAMAAGAGTVPIGTPIANVRLHVLDRCRQPVPVGVPGELYVTGAGVARGYLQRDDLTADRFVDLGEEGRAYRTGDRVRRLPGGAVEFLGRTDDQVKIRGYRVELGEIEQVLAEHPGIAQAVAAVLHGGTDPQLVAYTVAQVTKSDYSSAHTARATPASLIEWAASRLPDYMVPTAVIMLDRVPLGANGKIDRAALPLPSHETPVAPQVIAPRTPTEEAIAAIWMDVLKKEAVSVDDDFIALGGHSLLAIRVLGRLSRKFGVRLPLRTLFDAPTVSQLSEIVDLEVQLAAVSALTDGDA